MLGRQNVRNFCCETLALNSIFGLCFMPVYLIKSNCYSLIYSSLALPYKNQCFEKQPYLVDFRFTIENELFYLVNRLC